MNGQKTKNISIRAFWEFCQNEFHHLLHQKSIPEHYYFCDNEIDANACANLVVRKIKQATAPSLWWYEKTKTPQTVAGDLAIVTDWVGNPKALIEFVKTERVSFDKINAAFARAEGEGDMTLAYWKKVHKEYYIKQMKESKVAFHPKMIIVCEYFKTLITIEDYYKKAM